jgi:hypothetical protein
MLLIPLLEANHPSRFKPHVENTNLLDKIAEHLIAKALGKRPAAVAKARRRLEAAGWKLQVGIGQKIRVRDAEFAEITPGRCPEIAASALLRV